MLILIIPLLIYFRRWTSRTEAPCGGNLEIQERKYREVRGGVMAKGGSKGAEIMVALGRIYFLTERYLMRQYINKYMVSLA